ncbi:MAG: ribokinase [Bacteroidales bacterium]|nr:ribokinase [Bacteroidales bacterium]MCF8406147.1 ribokinase [Bacteroidales bacterium]
MKNKIVVIGSSNVDMTMKVDHIPVSGETLTGGVFSQVFGGKGANQAVSAARAGGDVAFISSVGDDLFTPAMVRNFNDDNINTKYLFKEPTQSCGSALIIVGKNGQNIITVAAGANQKLSPDHLKTASPVILGSEIIILQNEIPPETVEFAIKMAKYNKIKVLWNFAPALEVDKNNFSMVDFLVLNEVEAEFLSRMKILTIEDAESAAEKIKKLGSKTVIITLGSQGCFGLGEDFKIHIPTPYVEVLDTTAAGDVFCGSFAVAYTEKQNIEAAMRFATVASALSVSKIGAQPSAPTRKEIECFMKNVEK